MQASCIYITLFSSSFTTLQVYRDSLLLSLCGQVSCFLSLSLENNFFSFSLGLLNAKLDLHLRNIWWSFKLTSLSFNLLILKLFPIKTQARHQTCSTGYWKASSTQNGWYSKPKSSLSFLLINLIGLIWFLIFFCGFLVFSKTAIKLTKTRIEMIRRKRNAMQKYLRNDIAVLLRDGLDINAYGRVSWFFFFSLSFSFLLILNGLFNFPFWFLIPLSGNRINAFNSPLCVCVCFLSFLGIMFCFRIGFSGIRSLFPFFFSLSWYYVLPFFLFYVLFSNWVFFKSKPTFIISRYVRCV